MIPPIVTPLSIVHEELIKLGTEILKFSHEVADKCADAYVAAIPKWDEPILTKIDYAKADEEQGPRPEQSATQSRDDEAVSIPWLDVDGIVCVLLVDHEYGQLFTNQAGGYACRHPEERGDLRIVPGSSSLLEDFFVGSTWAGWCCDGLDALGDDTLEKTIVLVEAAVPDFVVDRSRIKESQEAWIRGAYAGKPAVLAWNNSD